MNIAFFNRERPGMFRRGGIRRHRPARARVTSARSAPVLELMKFRNIIYPGATAWERMSKHRTPFQKWKLTVLAIFVAWLAVLLIAPLTLPTGSVKDLSGAVGRLDNPAQEARMNPFADVVYTMGDIECHQIAARSFYLNGNELPVCSRDIGLSIGLLTGMLDRCAVRQAGQPVPARPGPYPDPPGRWAPVGVKLSVQ